MECNEIDNIDWKHVFEQDVSYTVDTVRGGHFILEMARHIAKEDCSAVRNAAGKIIEDFRRK